MLFRPRAFRVAILAIVASIPACSKSPTHPVGRVGPVGCSGSVTLNVTPALAGSGAPRFDWSPACGITNLTVIVLPQGIGDPALVWAFSASEWAQIGPPVDYGHVPAGARSQSVAQPLQPGVTYRVSIFSTIGLDGITAEAEKTFVP